MNNLNSKKAPKLKQLAPKTQAILNALPDPIFIRGCDRELLFKNKIAYSVCPRSTGAYEDPYRFFPDNVKEQLSATRTEVLNTGQPAPVEVDFYIDGEPTLLEICISILNLDGEEDLLMERMSFKGPKEIDHSLLKKENSYLRRALELNDTAIFSKNLDGEFTFANERFAEIYNTDVNNLIGKKESVFNPDPVQIQQYDEQDDLLIKNQEQIRQEEVVTNHEGEVRWLNTLRIPIWDEEGQIAEIMGVAVDVTEQKLNEMAREESEVRLRLVLNSNEDRIWAVDKNLELIFFNEIWEREFAEVFGVQPRRGDNIVDILPAEISNGWEIGYKAVFNGETLSNDWSYNTLDGERVDMAFTMSPIKDRDGNIIGCAGFAKDVTALRKAEEELRQTVASLTATLESTTDAILVVSKDRTITQFNSRMCEMWNIPAEMFEKGCQEAVLNIAKQQVADEAEFLRGVHKMYAKEDAVNCEIINFKDGRIIERYSLPQLSGNKIIGRVLSFRDITDKVKSEGLLRKNVTFLETLIESIPNPVFAKNRDLKFTMCNSAFAQILRLEKSDIIGKEVVDITSSRLDEICEHIDEKLIKTGGFHSRAFKLSKTDPENKYGEIIVQKQTFNDVNGEIDGIIGVIVDITEIKEAQNELQHKNEELQRYIDSNLQLENFAYFASHDLKEPLRTIGNFTQLLQKRYSDQLDKTAMEYMNFIVDGAQTMNRLINDLLTYSRVNSEEHDPEEINISSLLDSIAYNLRQAIDESSAQIEKVNMPATIKGSRTKLFQLFLNLLANALKFRKPDTPPHIIITSEEQDNHWLFSVADNGIGISPEFHEKIFVLFRKLHGRSRYEGTGIGLALCKKIVEQHGGKMWLTSEEGQGTTFYLTLQK